MFATLLGALPMPPAADRGNHAGVFTTAVETGATEGVDTASAAVETVIRAQEAAGLEPVTDGRLGDPKLRAAPSEAVARWKVTQSLTDRAVKQALAGPAGLTAAGGDVQELAAAMGELIALGCPLIELEEANVGQLDRADVRTGFVDAHERLFRALGPAAGATHLSLSLTAAPPADAIEALAALPYGSFAVDLIHGPDSWNLVTRLPGDRGVIAGVVSADGEVRSEDVHAGAGEPKEVLLWAANYAASTRGRGIARVGLGSAGSWANLTWDAAVARMRRLGEASRLASKPIGEDEVRELDPRAVSIRRAALGHDAPLRRNQAGDR